MSKNITKAKTIQIERITAQDLARVTTDKILQYEDPLPVLDQDGDLVHKKHLDDRLAEFDPADLFQGYYPDLTALNLEPGPFPDGAWALVGTGETFQHYDWDVNAEVWAAIQGEQGPPGVVDLPTLDARYIRRDVPEEFTEQLTVNDLVFADEEISEDPVAYLGVLADGRVKRVEISGVTGDKGKVMEVTVPSTEWVLDHNLGKYVGFIAKDSAGNPLYPDWNHPSVNQLVLSGFPGPVTGTVVMF